MKTIQIPMNSNPFTVVINNSVYQYKAGQTVEVPDEVAEVIALHEQAQAKALQKSMTESSLLVLAFPGITKTNLVAKEGVDLSFGDQLDYQTVLAAAKKGAISFAFVSDSGTIAVKPQVRTWENGLIEAHFMLLWDSSNAYWFSFNCTKDTGHFYRSNMYSFGVSVANP